MSKPSTHHPTFYKKKAPKTKRSSPLRFTIGQFVCFSVFFIFAGVGLELLLFHRFTPLRSAEDPLLPIPTERNKTVEEICKENSGKEVTFTVVAEEDSEPSVEVSPGSLSDKVLIQIAREENFDPYIFVFLRNYLLEKFPSSDSSLDLSPRKGIGNFVIKKKDLKFYTEKVKSEEIDVFSKEGNARIALAVLNSIKSSNQAYNKSTSKHDDLIAVLIYIGLAENSEASFRYSYFVADKNRSLNIN